MKVMAVLCILSALLMIGIGIWKHYPENIVAGVIGIGLGVFFLRRK